MKRLFVLGFVATVFAAVPGCSKNDPDSLTKQSISEMNELAAAIEKKESIDKIKSLAEKCKATEDKITALKLSPEDQKKMAEKYGKEILEAGFKLMGATLKNPEAMAALTSMGFINDKLPASSDNTAGTTPVGKPGGSSGPGRKR